MSNSVGFQVSAKTARLIGRENISGVDGAVLELVKNGYDADADCVYVKYDIPFTKIPVELSWTDIQTYFLDNKDVLEKYYDFEYGKYKLKTELSKIEMNELESLILSLSTIIIVDNGCGMTDKILKTTWMNIGTDDKEINVESNKKSRVKTGAKGIGRFALDKLSLKSQVITKNEDDEVYSWEIDWTQFDNAELLSEVAAKITTKTETFATLVKNLVGDEFKKLSAYEWETGTMIILSPIREFWNERSFLKVNKNLKNINPLGSVDRFDVIVHNTFFPRWNFQALSEGISRDDYDYKIIAKYDGENSVTLTMDRNEIDVKEKEIEMVIDDYVTGKEVIEKVCLDEFWDRDKFKVDKHYKDTYNDEVTYTYTLEELLPNISDEDRAEYLKIGPFDMQLYYIKNIKMKGSIIKDFTAKERKRLLEDFSGVKIYRDNFKVRPYGDEGIFYDWLNLSERVQKSPAAASHMSGNWRISPNQLIGSVSISRITNPNLMDTANREGMQVNDEYTNFINLLQKIIEKFEYDRQYPLREYAIWYHELEKKYQSRIRRTFEQVMKERQSNRNSEEDNKFENREADSEEDKKEEKNINKNTSQGEDYQYSEEDLKDVIYSIGKKEDDDLKTQQILMVLSSAGVMAQTFAHEISRVATNLGNRGQHLKESVNRMLNNRPYVGDEDFNPYDMIEELDDTDLLLSEWVNLIMESVRRENFYSQEIKVNEFLIRIRELWMPLLKKKYINIKEVKNVDDISLSLPEVDLHLILNNFLLNSAYFLEENDGEREIELSAYKSEGRVYLDMKNNGPKLSERFLQNPDEILDATISSKNDGTGLGLWIAREAVVRNSGELQVKLVDKGFMLQASWKI